MLKRRFISAVTFVGSIAAIVAAIVTVMAWSESQIELEATVIDMRVPAYPRLNGLVEEALMYDLSEAAADSRVPLAELASARPFFDTLHKKIFRETLDFYSDLAPRVVRIVVVNRSQRYAEAVGLRAPESLFRGEARVERAGSEVGEDLESVDFREVLPLGAMAPGEKITVYWYDRYSSLPSEMHEMALVHKDGRGEIFYMKPVPSFIADNDGLFVPYWGLPLWLTLAVALVVFGLVLGAVLRGKVSSLVRLRSKRRAVH